MSIEQNPQPVICPQCGQTNAQGRTECWNCKASLVPGASTTQKKTSCWLVGCIVTAIVGMIAIPIIAIGIGLYFRAQTPSREQMSEDAIRKAIIGQPMPGHLKNPLPAAPAKPKVK